MKPEIAKSMLRSQHSHRRHRHGGTMIVSTMDVEPIQQAPAEEEGEPMCGDVEPIRQAPAEEEGEPMCGVERLLGYRFRDRRLLEEALTHSSVADAEHPSYQRLEHVGDAALNLAFTNHFFLTNPSGSPGHLSNLRAANISTEKFARVAFRHNLYQFLSRSSPTLDEMVNEFTEAVMAETDQGFCGLPYGGATLKAPKVLAAAVYVDCNFNLVDLWKVFRGFMEPIITEGDLDEQPVATLYELCQKHHKAVQFKHMTHDKLVITNVFIDKELVGVGASEQKVISKLNATRDALLKLYKSLPPTMDAEFQILEEDTPKQKLNTLCTKKHWRSPIYKISQEAGPDHDKRFACSVEVKTPTKVFVAVGDLKPRVKDAENSVAQKMLAQIPTDEAVSLDN